MASPEAASVPVLPTGTVTFLFTDVEGSTSLWERHPEQMRLALIRHDGIIEALAQQHGGCVVRPRGEGDSRFCVFARPSDGVAAAAFIQRALGEEPWPVETPLRVRVALHTGEADLRDGDYYGSAVNRCARLRSIGHGGQTLLSQATYDLVRDSLPPGVALRDLGEQRLRDLIRPERVYQILSSAAPGLEFPPLRSLDAFPNNLPLQLTTFVGRETQVRDVRRLLGATRLLTLTGIGGCGKTRLALQVAAEVVDEYPDGVWFIALAPLVDPTLVPSAVADAVGAHPIPGQAPIVTLTGFLKAKRLLLVLDNCEHVLDACDRLADTVLRTCPAVKLLATSREGLGIEGERSWRVPSLQVPESGALDAGLARGESGTLQQLTQYEAVRLFIDRAVAVQPQFAVTRENASALAQICWRLDGIPLAIELAAARTKSLVPQQIASRLDDRFRLLTGGSRAALPRQQTLQALVDWSYDLLSEQEMVLLRRVAVFMGGWTLEAAEAICAGDGIEPWEVVDLIGHLVDKSLVQMEMGADGARYRLLETVRLYARDKLVESGEIATVRRRHRDYWVELGEELDGIRGADIGRKRATAILEAEPDNVRAALEWSLEGEAEEGLRLAVAMCRLWQPRYRHADGMKWLGLLLGAAPEPTALRAAALYWAGRLCREAGFIDEARPYLTEALPLSERFDLLDVRGGTVLNQGLIALADRDTQRSREYFEQSLAILRRLGRPAETASALRNLGILAMFEGDYEAARTAIEQSIAEINRTSGSVGRAMTLLAILARLQGDYTRARSVGEESLTMTREARFVPGIYAALGGLGDLALEQGDLLTARERYAELLKLVQDNGYDPYAPMAVCRFGVLAAREGDYERAGRLLAALTPQAEAFMRMHMPDIPPLIADATERVRSALGDAVVEAATREGRAMTIQEAAAYALASG